MKRLVFLIIICLIPSLACARDIKFYDKNYSYSGKIDSNTGVIYDKDYKRVGRVDKQTGKIYDRDYNRVGSTRSLIRGRK
jgi:hypothetical protein